MRLLKLYTLTLTLLTDSALNAQQRPVVQTKFTADPAPLVIGDTVFLYSSHDEDDAPEGYGTFKMVDWVLYTSTDLVNWTERGTIADLSLFHWLTPEEQKNGAWAVQVVERRGKYYMYCPIHMHGIGVLVSDSPYGPFHDPLGRPLIGKEFDSIDPTALQDDDGTVYLYWGNPNLWWVRLNDDMISFEGEPHKDARIRKVEGETDPFHYQEGPWAYKRNGKYYMAYASTCCPEGIGWAWSDHPTDHWQFGGHIMQGDDRSSGNHPGIFDFKGKTYTFGFNYYLNNRLTQKHHERRSNCLAELTFNADGSIRQLPWWEEGEAVTPVATLNPYQETSAATMAWSEGLKTALSHRADGTTDSLSVYVDSIGEGDWLELRNVDFGSKGTQTFTATFASERSKASIEVRLDDRENGSTIARLPIRPTGGAERWQTRQTKVEGSVSGIHSVFFIFHGNASSDLFHFRSWTFAQ